MSSKSNPKTALQWLGIALFSVALALLLYVVAAGSYQLDTAALKTALGNNEDYNLVIDKVAPGMAAKTYSSSGAFLGDLHLLLKDLQKGIAEDAVARLGLEKGSAAYNKALLPAWKLASVDFPVAKASSQGVLLGKWLWAFICTIGLGILGAMLYILPQARLLPGIKNNHVFHSAMHNRGWLGIAAGVFLIVFYIVLYFYPEYLVNWVLLVDPISRALSGNEASHWFLYGFLYTVAIVVMGTRMFIKYRHNRYQLLRTASVVFFQVCFAFLLPEIMVALNQPSMDLKNIWPLNYSFFFDYNIKSLMAGGGFGLFLLVWGVALIVVVVPVLTYFFGKRWYCSWVCGCGGLAETLGDPYRQLSDKSVEAWQIERWLIHSVLVFAVAMTMIVLYSFFPLAKDTDSFWNKTNFALLASGLLLLAAGWVHWRNLKAKALSAAAVKAMWIVALGLVGVLCYNHFVLENYGVKITFNRWVFMGGAVLLLGGLALWHRQRFPYLQGRKIITVCTVVLAALALWQWMDYQDTGKALASYGSGDVKKIYGFAISSIFAGVVGTGFYPLMGNRVWCRFGCPMAAYLGLMQKLESRFRITTNGGQCISCGNCSTYCEMGIDVRAYAQRGQDILRASCVGCGICSAVCPRGVLRLENKSDDVDLRAMLLRNERVFS